MDFKDFTDLMPKVNKIPLAGIKAHQEMAPLGREIDFSDLGVADKNPLNAGVTTLFYPSPSNETMLILILRNTYPGIHSGQMGFPGGRQEVRDENIEDTALRETYEEVGVRPSNICIVRKLTKTYIPPSNFWVHPFLAYAKSTPRFRRQESEVKELVPVRLEDFLDDANVVHQTISTSYGDFVDVPAFSFGGKTVWGATAMMLNEVKILLKEVI